MFCWFNLDYSVLVLFALVVLALVSLVLRQEIGWEARLHNDLFCVERDIKRQSMNLPEKPYVTLHEIFCIFFSGAVAQSSSDDSGDYVLPLSWMMSRLPIMACDIASIYTVSGNSVPLYFCL